MRRSEPWAPSATTRLFHFSDDGSIEVFLPREVRVPAKRAASIAMSRPDSHSSAYKMHTPSQCQRLERLADLSRDGRTVLRRRMAYCI
jgi:hypothetical protein